MKHCPICDGLGKIKIMNVTSDCMDCDGKGWISENKFKFIEFYHNKKKLEAEIEKITVEKEVEEVTKEI